MEFSENGGMSNYIQKIIVTKDMPSLIKMFKALIVKSYGEKSADGRRFIKVDRDGYLLVNDFMQTPAYSILYMELATNEEAASAFINAILPQEAVANLKDSANKK